MFLGLVLASAPFLHPNAEGAYCVAEGGSVMRLKKKVRSVLRKEGVYSFFQCRNE